MDGFPFVFLCFFRLMNTFTLEAVQRVNPEVGAENAHYCGFPQS